MLLRDVLSARASCCAASPRLGGSRRDSLVTGATRQHRATRPRASENHRNVTTRELATSSGSDARAEQPRLARRGAKTHLGHGVQAMQIPGAGTGPGLLLAVRAWQAAPGSLSPRVPAAGFHTARARVAGMSGAAFWGLLHNVSLPGQLCKSFRPAAPGRAQRVEGFSPCPPESWSAGRLMRCLQCHPVMF